MVLYVTPQEYQDIAEWTRLDESEYLALVLERWPSLWDHLYENIDLVVVWPDDRTSPLYRFDLNPGSARYRVVFRVSEPYVGGGPWPTSASRKGS
jgi:hypothetical protein